LSSDTTPVELRPGARTAPILALLLAAGLLFPSAAPAGEPYRLPPAEVVALVDAPDPPATSISPDRRSLLLIEQGTLPGIADLSRRMLRLAGLRIDPAANARFRAGFDRGLSVRPLRDPTATPRALPLPEGGKLAATSWSHDGVHFVWTVVTPEGSELWGATIDPSVPARRLVAGLSTILGGPEWLPDGRSLLVRLVPTGRGAEPAPPSAPEGPNVLETAGERTPLRTQPDLLANPYDEALFEHYATAQLAIVRFGDGTGEPEVAPIGAPAIFLESSVSPDGEHLLVAILEKPWSYSMPVWSFPHRYEVWSLAGELEHRVAEIPLEKDVPIEGVPTGPRSIRWHPALAATLLWVEALDGGDPKVEVPHRDRWIAHAAPFEGEPKEIRRIEHRAWGIEFLADPTRFIFEENDRDRRWTRSTLADLDDPGIERVLEDRSSRDRYGDPGNLVTEPLPTGGRVVAQRGEWVLRTGSGATPEGQRPFLSRQSLATGEREELWRTAPGSYEPVVAAWHEGDAIRFVTRHESPTSPPNLRLRSLDESASEPMALTAFPDPTPQVRGVTKRLITYERADGVPLSATLYLPADHRDGDVHPLLVWAYPLEFSDAGTAGQVAASPDRFTRIEGASHLHLLTQGYAILDGAAMPIVGHPETMNDTFIQQLVDSARAAIDAAVSLGVADRERVAVGGHSYGAFMTANLLAHSDLFRAGIARSGAYNRTLTPFGFQAERRTLWEASAIYTQISPFFHAEKIDEPILLIHGEEDDNSGTYPIQSQRLFAAIQGTGGTARLVMLPSESHGYRARESVLHVLAETIDWLDRHVKAPEVVPAGFDERER